MMIQMNVLQVTKAVRVVLIRSIPPGREVRSNTTVMLEHDG